MSYPRGLEKEFDYFDPIQVSRDTEMQVTDGDKRKYNGFKEEPFYGGIYTARGVGCNLRCAFCWINPSRDFPEKYGTFYSPEEVHQKLAELSSRLKGTPTIPKRVRISGCEPTIGQEHLLSVIESCQKGETFSGFLLETNGILFGSDENYVKQLKKFGDFVQVRLSFKAGTPEAFQQKTGSRAEFFDLPFQSLEYLQRHNISYRLAAMSADPAIMPAEERGQFLARLVSYGTQNLRLLEEERTDPFGITLKRLLASGVDPSQIRQRVYEPLKRSIERALDIRRGDGFSDTGLDDFFRSLPFNIEASPCATCPNIDPWGGDGTYDDLDPRLGVKDY